MGITGLRGMLTAVAVAMVVTTGGGLAHAAGPDVYTTPGGQAQGGRLWNTTCARYSSTTVRCTTDIWATQVVHRGGRYVPVTGWHFNNLTYLPSNRAQWSGNPLAAYGKVGGTATWTSAGRKWRTECDTSATGRGACRSFIWTTYSSGTRPYTQKSGWVFNNIVRFAQGGVKPVSSVPAHILDQSVLTINGLGPLGVRTNYEAVMADYARLGYVRTSEHCDAWNDAHVLEARGISLTGLPDVSVTNPRIRTDKGAHVGMTYAQVRALYGSAFRTVAKDNYGVTQYFGSVRSGGRELLFRVEGGPDGHGGRWHAPLQAPKPGDEVVEISAGPFTDEVSYDGC